MRALFILSLTIFLGSCSPAEWNSINRQFNPTDGDSRLIDAKQRAIIAVTRDVINANGKQVEGMDGKPVTVLAVCAEPSPDALQATATALAGEGSGDALRAVLNLSGFSSESAASIGLRTQTIQLLRDAYFRLCEAYLNDGIDSIAYDVLQRRFQNQIVALLAVEQLTGVVKADQVSLNTSAAGNAGAQAQLIAQILEAAEEDLLRLQGAQDHNATELAQLKEQEIELENIKQSADDDSNENDETKRNTALQSTAAQAKNNYETNANEIKAAERRKLTLEGQIERKNQQIATLIEAFGEAARATITSNATGMATLGGGDTVSNASHISEVVNAVRAITLNAINQDYEAQVCFEALRYRNNVSRFKNYVNEASQGITEQAGLESIEKYSSTVDGSAMVFTEYCKDLFEQQVELRRMRAELARTHGTAIGTLINKVVGQSNGSISSDDAIKLILTLSHSTPTEPGVAFLKRQINIPQSEGSNGTSVESQETREFTQDIRKLLKELSIAHSSEIVAPPPME